MLYEQEVDNRKTVTSQLALGPIFKLKVKSLSPYLENMSELSFILVKMQSQTEDTKLIWK